MSAAEKLKALGEAMAGRTEVTLEGQVRVGAEARSTYLHALPQIVAVVEAAERLEPDQQHIDLATNSWVIDPRLASALAALDEKLGDVT